MGLCRHFFGRSAVFAAVGGLCAEMIAEHAAGVRPAAIRRIAVAFSDGVTGKPLYFGFIHIDLSVPSPSVALQFAALLFTASETERPPAFF